jgi:CspA family cold shock protein
MYAANKAGSAFPPARCRNSVTKEAKEMANGTVKKWVDDRGFGFIARDDDSTDLFTHCSQIKGASDYLKPGQRVEFDEGERNGKPCAVNVRVL